MNVSALLATASDEFRPLIEAARYTRQEVEADGLVGGGPALTKAEESL